MGPAPGILVDMAMKSDQQRVAELVVRLRQQLERRSLVGQAAGMLMERYRLTPSQALTFIDEKARESGRSAADVAVEILERQRHLGRSTASAPRGFVH